MRRTVGAIVASLILTTATSTLADPITLEQLFKLPINKASAVALGPEQENFVERSPWNSIEPNFVLNTVHLFGMSFYTHAESISPTACSAILGWAVFDSAPDPSASDAEKAALDKVPYPQRPMRRTNFGRKPVYFVAGPPLPTPLVPGGDPEPLSPSSRSPNSCDNPVSGRKTFEALSTEDAVAAVDLLNILIKDASSKQPVPFKLSCELNMTPCGDARRSLASLEIQALWMVRKHQCAASIPANDCTEYDIDDKYQLGHASDWWVVNVDKTSNGAVVEVRMRHDPQPVI